MSALAAAARVLARVGDATDGAVQAVRVTPRVVRGALAERRERWVFGIATVVILLGYLLAIGDLALSASGRWAEAPAVRFTPDSLLRTRAPWLFEPILELHPGAHLAVFASPINLLLALVVASLAGANLALATHTARHAVACRRPGYSRAFAVLPSFLLGFACCAPTFILALGTSTAAAVLPVLLPLRPWFYPLTLFLLMAALVWGARRVARARAAVMVVH